MARIGAISGALKTSKRELFVRKPHHYSARLQVPIVIKTWEATMLPIETLRVGR